MKIESVKDIEKLVRSDEWMMKCLRAAEDLNLPDWWIGAGFLRNRVWDEIEGNESTKPTDVDLVYFDSNDSSKETDEHYDEAMIAKYPFANWEVRNQARMHAKNGFEPYNSTAEGISNWVETATCVAVRIKNEKLDFLFCHGLDDLIDLIARPTPRFQAKELIGIFKKRVKNKKWQEKWPRLKIELL